MRFRHNGGDELQCPMVRAEGTRRHTSRHNPCIYNSRKKSHTMFEFHRNERLASAAPQPLRSGSSCAPAPPKKFLKEPSKIRG